MTKTSDPVRDNEASASEEDDYYDPVREYLKRRFGGDGPKCPLCEALSWFSPPDGPHVLEGMPQTTSLSAEPEQVGWAPPVGAWVCICSNCGYVMLLLDEFVRAGQETS